MGAVTPSSSRFILAAGLLAVLAGLVQLVMGLARLGILVNFVSDVEQILVEQPASPAIPIDQLSTCTEDGLRVRRGRDAVGGGGQQPRMP